MENVKQYVQTCAYGMKDDCPEINVDNVIADVLNELAMDYNIEGNDILESNIEEQTQMVLESYEERHYLG